MIDRGGCIVVYIGDNSYYALTKYKMYTTQPMKGDIGAGFYFIINDKGNKIIYNRAGLFISLDVYREMRINKVLGNG